MKNLTYTERRMLIIKHLKEGYTFQEAIEIMKKDCNSIKVINKNHREEKKVDKKSSKKIFDKEFNKMAISC